MKELILEYYKMLVNPKDNNDLDKSNIFFENLIYEEFNFELLFQLLNEFTNEKGLKHVIYTLIKNKFKYKEYCDSEYIKNLKNYIISFNYLEIETKNNFISLYICNELIDNNYDYLNNIDINILNKILENLKFWDLKKSKLDKICSEILYQCKDKLESIILNISINNNYLNFWENLIGIRYQIIDNHKYLELLINSFPNGEWIDIFIELLNCCSYKDLNESMNIKLIYENFNNDNNYKNILESLILIIRYFHTNFNNISNNNLYHLYFLLCKNFSFIFLLNNECGNLFYEFILYGINSKNLNIYNSIINLFDLWQSYQNLFSIFLKDKTLIERIYKISYEYLDKLNWIHLSDNNIKYFWDQETYLNEEEEIINEFISDLHDYYHKIFLLCEYYYEEFNEFKEIFNKYLFSSDSLLGIIKISYITFDEGYYSFLSKFFYKLMSEAKVYLENNNCFKNNYDILLFKYILILLNDNNKTDNFKLISEYIEFIINIISYTKKNIYLKNNSFRLLLNIINTFNYYNKNIIDEILNIDLNNEQNLIENRILLNISLKYIENNYYKEEILNYFKNYLLNCQNLNNYFIIGYKLLEKKINIFIDLNNHYNYFQEKDINEFYFYKFYELLFELENEENLKFCMVNIINFINNLDENLVRYCKLLSYILDNISDIHFISNNINWEIINKIILVKDENNQDNLIYYCKIINYLYRKNKNWIDNSLIINWLNIYKISNDCDLSLIIWKFFNFYCISNDNLDNNTLSNIFMIILNDYIGKSNGFIRNIVELFEIIYYKNNNILLNWNYIESIDIKIKNMWINVARPNNFKDVFSKFLNFWETKNDNLIKEIELLALKII